MKTSSIPTLSKTFSLWATLYFKKDDPGKFGDIFYQSGFMDLVFHDNDGCKFSPILRDSSGT